jgi:transcriptional regulator with XRE-family HTH domain
MSLKVNPKRTESMDRHSPFHPEAVGLRLIALREFHGRTRSDFAGSVGIDPTSYGKIEKGRKPLKADMAFKIAERWGVSMDYLYRGRMTELPANLADSLMKSLTNQQP